MDVIRIRRGTEADIEAMLGLEQALFPEPWSEAMLRQEIEAPGRTYLVAELDGVVSAYGGIMVIGTDAHLMTVGVASNRQRRGLGARMLLALVEEALDQGAEHLTLEVRVSNAPALRLYEKFGFTPVGVRPRYYRDEDAVVMWALDVAGADYQQALARIREEAA